MKFGTVVGSVWATRKSPSLSGHTFLVVKTDVGTFIADDLVGAGTGDYVLLCSGSGARLDTPNVPIDLAVIGILDQTEETYVD